MINEGETITHVMDRLNTEASMAASALMDELIRADRWATVIKASRALLNVQRIAADHRAEYHLFQQRNASRGIGGSSSLQQEATKR